MAGGGLQEAEEGRRREGNEYLELRGNSSQADQRHAFLRRQLYRSPGAQPYHRVSLFLPSIFIYFFIFFNGEEGTSTFELCVCVRVFFFFVSLTEFCISFFFLWKGAQSYYCVSLSMPQILYCFLF